MPKLKSNQFLLDGHLITERPILFQTEMVQANMEDRKTQTRREVKLDTGQLIADQVERVSNTYFSFKKDGQFIAGRNCKFGKPGDLLWVRENFLKVPYKCGDDAYSICFPDKCSKEVLKRLPLRPSIHLPKRNARLWLMVEDIRVERVQDISEADAIAEGVEYIKSSRVLENGYKNYHKVDLDDFNFHKAKRSFESLWTSINGYESWRQNPWLWVIQYHILSKIGRPSDEIILNNYLDITEIKEASHA